MKSTESNTSFSNTKEGTGIDWKRENRTEKSGNLQKKRHTF
jgi:hypothetical protein